MEEKKISREEFIERLIYNDFSFKTVENKLYVICPNNKELKDNLFGYTYSGLYFNFYYELEKEYDCGEDEKIEDVIYEAFIKYQGMILGKICDKTNKLKDYFTKNLL